MSTPGKTPEGLSTEVRDALERYVGAGCPGDVNAYLDQQELSHPRLEHERKSEFLQEAEREAVVPCGDGFHPVSEWVPDRAGGHLFWSCEPN